VLKGSREQNIDQLVELLKAQGGLQ
jgi:hypothetical protein